jgi:prepilin-type N-terminal cleavage/methylation domain-containing protein
MFKKTNQKGFTLIELMVVISIISLLLSTVAYAFSETKKKGDDAHMQEENKQVNIATNLYKADNGGLVPGANTLTSGEKGQMHQEGSVPYNTAMQELVSKGYYPSIPKSPSGSSYSYMISPDGQSAVFAASLNKPTSNSSKNKCSIVNNTPTYSGCVMTMLIYHLGYTGPAISCANSGYNPNTQACFEGDMNSIGCGCSGSSLSANPSERLPVCQAMSYSCPLPTFSLIPPMMITCNSSGGNAVCGGGSNKDFCSCI